MKTEGELADQARYVMSIFACVIFFAAGIVAHWLFAK